MVIGTKHLLLTALLLCLLTGTGIGIWSWLRPTDEKRIRERFGKLSELVAKTGKEGAIPAAGKPRRQPRSFPKKAPSAWTDWTGWPDRSTGTR